MESIVTYWSDDDSVLCHRAKTLLGRAQEASGAARPTVSDFSVGAAAMLQDGSVWTGANVENITLNLTQCAERNLVMLLVQAKQEGKVVAVAVYGPKSDRLSPCGSCRQLMSEYLPATTRLIFRWGDAIMNAPLSALLPYSPEVKL